MARPDYMKPELANMLSAYKLCRDCYMGELAVKNRINYSQPSHNNGGGTGQAMMLSPYLPDPSPASESESMRIKRYNDYVTRAVFYNVTKRTVKAMTGEVFSKYPLLTLGQLDVLETDVNGAGQSLTQQAKDALTNLLLTGRGGFLADMPVNQTGASLADVRNRQLRPTIAHYDSESIINWRYRKVGGVYKLSLVVLSESYVASDDGFEAKTGRQLLVLRLNDNDRVESEIYRKADGNSEWVSQGINSVTDNKGAQLTEIPFFACGSVNNDLEPDDIPAFDIAHLNIAHLRNSADYEESLAISQPTLAISGLTQDWVDDVLADGIAMGSRSGIMLPVGGKAELLQPDVNDSNMTAMKHKEAMMASLGAKLIELGGSTNKTATQSNNELAEQTSVLSTLANNISDALTKSVKACARFMGYDDKDLVVTLNTDFGFAKMTPEQRQQLLQEYQAGAITWAEYRGKLVENEIATEENPETAKSVIEQEQGALIYGGDNEV